MNVIKLRSTGLSAIAISKIVNLSPYKVRKILKNAGLDVTKRYRTKSKDLNQNIFEDIDTYEKAYWLGLLYADGALVDSKKNYQVTLCMKDHEHVLKFQSFLDSNHKIYGREKGCLELTISNRKLFEDLHRHGCTVKKSHSITFPSLPDELLSCFMLGFFDGDGCITERVFEIYSGSLEFIAEYQRILCEKTKATKNKIYFKPSSNCYSISFYGDSNLLKIYNFLYQKESSRLERKYKRFTDRIQTLLY